MPRWFPKPCVSLQSGIKIKKSVLSEVFLEQYGNPFVAIGRDDDGRTGMEWGVYGVPETYLIDRSGQIKWRHAGPLTRDVINTQLLAKLAKMQ